MGIKDKLLTVSEREDGGRTAYDRFDYQTAWGLAKVLDLHEAGKNYAVAFEFHDDVVALDDADEPTKAVFYQVKTKKDGEWTFAKITSRTMSEGVKKPSFAGKMYDNFVRFGAVVEKLVFVSNQPMPDVVVVHGEKGFSDGKEKKLKEFVTRLIDESPGFLDPEHTSLFFFEFSNLNLSGYENAVMGRVATFLEQELGPHIPPRPFALMLNDYCRKRSKALADFTGFDELKSTKFVKRADMVQWLSHLRDQHERRPDWHSVSGELDLPFPDKTKISRAWRDYEVGMRARPNVAAIAMHDRIRALIDAQIDSAADLSSLVDAVFGPAKLVVQTWKPDADAHFVTAVILYEFSR